MESTDENELKHVRHRKKKYYNSIREQMEFYFGDANLSKDRFLMKLIKEDPYVPLVTFLSFNKMKKLTNSVDEIAKSLKNSDLLELNEDGTKVHRKTEIPKERNVDDKTLYVESLPQHANHDWVMKVFSRYGKISYVSLPRYKKSRKIKQFGFIEFENESSVKKALRAFKEFDGVLGFDTTDPSNLKSIISFVKEQNEEKSDELKDNENSKETILNMIEKENKKIDEEMGIDNDEINTLKRKKNKESDEENEEIVIKKSKVDIKENNENEGGVTSDSSIESTENEENQTEDQTNENNKNASKKKNRKHKKRKNQLKSVDESEFRVLKVMSKKEWKRLRNKYLNMQREMYKEFKRIRNRSHQNSQQQKPSANSAKSNNFMQNQQQAMHNVNFYGANEDLKVNDNEELAEQKTKESEKTNVKDKEPSFQFEPGIIVRIKLLEPCTDLKSLKNDMKQYNSVQYVDLTEGSNECYIRCDTPQNCEKFAKQISCAEYQCQILSGIEEQEYFKKIMKDRELKLNKKVKIKQRRGKEKIVKAISKHIRFDDD